MPAARRAQKAACGLHRHSGGLFAILLASCATASGGLHRDFCAVCRDGHVQEADGKPGRQPRTQCIVAGAVVWQASFWPTDRIRDCRVQLPENGRERVIEWRADGSLKGDFEMAGQAFWGKAIDIKADGSRVEAYMYGLRRDGPYREWRPDGSLVVEGVYHNDEKSGIWRYWDQNGVQTRCELWQSGVATNVDAESCARPAKVLGTWQYDEDYDAGPATNP